VSHQPAPRTTTPISRRTALRAGVAAGAAGVGMTASAANPSHAAAQEATPTGRSTEHLEVAFTPVHPVSITLAGGGPPQRGDHFFVDAAIYAVDDVNGTQIGTYQCFGAWTAAADATDAPNQRFTTVQYMMDDGAIMGLINEAGADPDSHVGAVQGGTGRFVGASGTFQQITVQGPQAGVIATPGAPGTPGPGQFVVRAVFDLTLPRRS
jgi:hypothetical protein